MQTPSTLSVTIPTPQISHPETSHNATITLPDRSKAQDGPGHGARTVLVVLQPEYRGFDANIRRAPDSAEPILCCRKSSRIRRSQIPTCLRILNRSRRSCLSRLAQPRLSHPLPIPSRKTTGSCPYSTRCWLGMPPTTQTCKAKHWLLLHQEDLALSKRGTNAAVEPAPVVPVPRAALVERESAAGFT
jgi:hypothetical protein